MKAVTLLSSLALALSLASGAIAQGTAATARPETNAKGVQQKAAMVERLLFNSPVATRVNSGRNEEARRHLNDAREYYTHGKALAASGQLRGADLLMNEAIWEIGRAQALAPDPSLRVAEERNRYGQLKASVDALLRTYELGVTGPNAITLTGNTPTDRSVMAAMAHSEQARTLADNSKLVEANAQLEQALAILLKDALGRVDGRTLVYDRRFDTVQQEFAWELDRLRSYEGLVPLAVLEYRPSREAVALIERYVGQAKALRGKAESQAAANDHAAGVQSLVEATNTLQRALQAAGLSVPQTMGTQ